jgi:DNA-binding MarR family transcriptional regulator
LDSERLFDLRHINFMVSFVTIGAMTAALDLDSFFPYRLAVLAETVSRSIADVYETRFKLSRDEWRVLVALAGDRKLRGAQLIAHTSLDKMQVSRAVAGLERAKLVRRAPDPEDGRAQLWSLSAAGRALYAKIVPMVKAREAFLLAELAPGEREALVAAFDKLRERAHALREQG